MVVTMSSERANEILALIERLKGDIRLAHKQSLDHTARLLKMALLDLNMMTNAISDDEMRAFTDSLEEASAAANRFELPVRKH